MNPCFGKYWEITRGSKCIEDGGCSIYNDCLAHFASKVLVKHQRSLGKESATVELLSEISAVSPESIRMALQYQVDEKIEVYPTEEEVSEPEDVTEPEIEKTPTTKQWDPKHNESRWLRERKRSPLIAKLLPGMKINKKWRGTIYSVIVHKGYYLYNDTEYPTLYSVVVAITGTKPCPKQKRRDGTMPTGTRQLTSWSATRFFGLNRLLGGKTGSRSKKKGG